MRWLSHKVGSVPNLKMTAPESHRTGLPSPKLGRISHLTQATQAPPSSLSPLLRIWGSARLSSGGQAVPSGQQSPGELRLRLQQHREVGTVPGGRALL